jgi:hypothetical protein
MSILLPNTPEKGGGATESSSVRSVSFSIPDTLSTYLGDNFTLPSGSSHATGSIAEGSTWPTRDVTHFSFYQGSRQSGNHGISAYFWIISGNSVKIVIKKLKF